MIKFRMLRPDGVDGVVWESLYRRLPWGSRTIHHSPGYARAQEATGFGGEAWCAVAYDTNLGGGLFLLQPFMFKPDGPLIESLYGYGGPATSGGMTRQESVAFFERIEIEMAEYRRQRGVICERVVLTPRLAHEQANLYASLGVASRRVKDVVVVATEPGHLRNGMTEKRRAAVKKAMADGIRVDSTCSLGYALSRFHDLYRGTMDRVGAAPRWQLPRGYFEANLREMPRRSVIVQAWLADAVVSSALVLMDGTEAHYQFAGNSGVSGASDLLILESARLAHEAGCATLNLGGGVTAAEDDSVFWYKSTFSPGRLGVEVVERVHDRETFDRLSRGHEAAGFFPPWRAGAALAQSIGGQT